MNQLKMYNTLDMEGFLNFLKRNSNAEETTQFSGKINPVDFIAELQRGVPYHTDVFIRGSKKVTVEDKRAFRIYPAKTDDDPFLSLVGKNESSDNPIAEVYFERGKDAGGRFKGDPYADDMYNYEYMRLKIPDGIDLQSGRIIPACTVKIQTESRCPSNFGLRRRDHTRTFFCWHRANLEKMLPNSLFLKGSDPKYYPVADI